MIRKISAFLIAIAFCSSACAFEVTTPYFSLNSDNNWMPVSPISDKTDNFLATFADSDLNTIVTITITPGTFGAEAAAYATIDRMRAARLTVGSVENIGNGIFTLTFVLKDGTPGICYFKDDGARYGVVNILGKDHAPGYAFLQRFTNVDYSILPEIKQPAPTPSLSQN